MKRTIQALLLILTVSLFATSCSKTARNEFAISGRWELLKTVITTEDGKIVSETYSAQDSRRTFYNFDSNGTFTQSIISINGTSDYTGRWVVDDDLLVMSYADRSESYVIEETSLLMIELSQRFTEDGKKYIRTLTLKIDTTTPREDGSDSEK